MKNVLKLGAVVLAIVMVLSMSVTAFASGSTTIPSGGANPMPGIGQNPTDREHDAFNAVENTVQLTKSIVFINSETTNVYEPNITYTYTITGVDVTDGAVTVTDEHTATPAHQVVVNDGNTTYVSGGTTKTVTFADGNAFVNATSAGTELTKNFTFSFNTSAFPHAGVYRFLITETVNTNAREIAGVVSSATYAPARYLDVYVRNGSSGYEIYGYVLFEASTGDQDISGTTTKSNGWVNTAASGAAPADVDVYTTYNATVSKTTTGSLADKTHYFPVTVTFTNTAADSSSVNYGRITKIRTDKNDKATGLTGTTTWTGTPDTSQASNAYVALNGATAVTVGGTFKDGGELYFYGIPADTTINAEETNDTYDVYTATAVVDSAGSNASLSYKTTSSAEAATGTSASLSQTGTAKLETASAITATKTIAFTNTLSEISPTGVVLRVAPFALMLGVGIFLLLVSKKRRHPEEA